MGMKEENHCEVYCCSPKDLNKLVVEPVFETSVYHVTRPKKIEKSGHFLRPNASIHDKKTMPSPNLDLGTILIIFRVFPI